MKIVSTIEEVRAQVKEWKKEGQSIGFVPTMGYLHEGHMSLIDAAGEKMYGDQFYSYVDMDVLTKELCGLSRPVHFRGVCTVVTKLFNIVTPDRAYFGQKDAQQLAVIKRMVKDLNMPLTITGCPIIREADGLAKSSRNTYLSIEEREAALVLSRSIFLGKEMVEKGERDCKKILAAMTAEIEK